MSLKGLTADERGVYLTGLAVMAQLENVPYSRQSVRENRMINCWKKRWLTLKEYDSAMLYKKPLWERTPAGWAFRSWRPDRFEKQEGLPSRPAS